MKLLGTINQLLQKLQTLLSMLLDGRFFTLGGNAACCSIVVLHCAIIGAGLSQNTRGIRSEVGFHSRAAIADGRQGFPVAIKMQIADIFVRCLSDLGSYRTQLVLEGPLSVSAFFSQNGRFISTLSASGETVSEVRANKDSHDNAEKINQQWKHNLVFLLTGIACGSFAYLWGRHDGYRKGLSRSTLTPVATNRQNRLESASCGVSVASSPLSPPLASEAHDYRLH